VADDAGRRSPTRSSPASWLQAPLSRVARAIEGPDGQPLAWTLRDYPSAWLRDDLVAGLTVAALIIPLSIGYAGVAGLPPEVGLYASMAPLIAYAIFGSGRRLIVGPDASTAALVGASIAPLALSIGDRAHLASVLGLLVGFVFVGMRLARLGFIADFLSRPILVGYMTGVGVVVALDQLPKILGGQPLADAFAVFRSVDVASVGLATFLESVGLALRQGGVNLVSLTVGMLVIVAMLLGGRFLPRVPMALPALIGALLASAAFDLQARGVQVLGPVPGGLPPVGVPTASANELISLLPGALAIAVLSFADTSLTGRSFAARHGEETDPDRELVALAAADLAGSLSGGYPISSSPSRTSAAESAGSQSQLIGFVAFGVIALVLLFLTGPLQYLPQPALGAVVLLAAIRFIDVGSMLRMWNLDRSEGLIAFAAAAGVIAYGTLVGVGVAVLLAAFNVVRRAAWPPIVELGRLPNGMFADVGRVPEAGRVPGVVVLRFAGPLFFANIQLLRNQVRRGLASRPDARAVVLDLGVVSDVDLTAANGIQQLRDRLARDDISLFVARPIGLVRDELRLLGLASLLETPGVTTRTVDEAVVAALASSAGTDAPPPVAKATVAGNAIARSGSPSVDERPERASAADTAGPGMGPGIEPPGASGDRSRRYLRPLVGIIAIGAVAVIGVVILRSLASGPPATPSTSGQVTVPNLVGLPLSSARSVAASKGLQIGTVTYVQLDDRPQDTVIAQSPAPGVVVDRGTDILPTVATTRQIVVVPDVVGGTDADAIVAITSAGLQVGPIERVPDASVPDGLVVSVSPPAGTQVPSGTKVSLVVSTGPPSGPSPSESAGPSPAPSSSPGRTALPSESPKPSPSPTSSPAQSASPTTESPDPGATG
jgi:high affinity sulfate transporter 1